MKRPVFLAALALALGAAPAFQAQEAPAGPAVLKQGVRSAVQVTAMDLDVVATQNGKPVLDLTKDEIRVTANGKPVALDYFARIDAGAIHGPDLKNASPDLVLESEAQDDGTRYVPRQFLVFFDDDHLLPADRNRVIEALRSFITRLAPSDRVSVMTYDGAPRVLVPFTSSKEDLFVGLLKLQEKGSNGLRWQSMYQQSYYDARTARTVNSRRSMLDAWSQQLRARDTGMLQDLRRVVSGLAGRSGKRVFLFVSNGFELFPGQTLQQAFGTGLGQFTTSLRGEFDAVIKEANESGVTFHTIHAAGLDADGDVTETGINGVLDEEGNLFRESLAISPINRFYKDWNFKTPLANLAQETGGTFTANRNTFKDAFDRIYLDSSTYYSAGVTLANIQAKDAIKVKVTTTRPGVTLRVRNSWAHKTSDEAAKDRVEMALLTPDVKGDFQIGLTLGASKPGGLGRRLVPFEVVFPIKDLTFVDEGGKKKAVFDITVAAVEDNGSKSNVVPQRLQLAIPPEEFEKAKTQGYRHSGELKTGKGNFRYIASVRDVASDRIGLASQSVHIE